MYIVPYGFKDIQASSITLGRLLGSPGPLWGLVGAYLQDGPPALGCMLAASWAAPGHPVQGHVAVRAHTVGAVVVIDEAGPELGTLPTNHLGGKWARRA